MQGPSGHRLACRIAATCLVGVLLPLHTDATHSQRPDPLAQAYLSIISTYLAGDVDRARAEISRWQQRDVLRVIELVKRLRPGLPADGYQPDVQGWNLRILAGCAVFNVALAAAPGVEPYNRDFTISVARQFLTVLVSGSVPPEADRVSLSIALLLQSLLKVEELGEYLDWAGERFPGSPALLLARGSFHELMSAQRLEAAREARFVSRDTSESNRKAVAFYEAALSRDRELAEARVRLGHALSSLGRYDAAERELRTALARAVNTDDVYLAWLFLAAVQERRNETDAALLSYQHAVAICGGCQSPRFGLARIYAARGDLPRLSDALEDALKTSDQRTDPWSLYDFGQAKTLPALLSDLQGSLR